MAIVPGRPEELDAIAAALGADVPSQLVPGLALGTGAGDLVEPREPLEPHAYVIVPSARAALDRRGLPRGRPARAGAPGGGAARALRAAAAPRWRAGGRLPGELIVNDLAAGGAVAVPLDRRGARGRPRGRRGARARLRFGPDGRRGVLGADASRARAGRRARACRRPSRRDRRHPGRAAVRGGRAGRAVSRRERRSARRLSHRPLRSQFTGPR